MIYYACLAAFWAGLLYVFLQTVDLEKPTYSSYVSRPGKSNTWAQFQGAASAEHNILLDTFLLSRNEQDTSHKLYMWHGSLAVKHYSGIDLHNHI